jgi:hypothetical protein
VIRCGTTWHPDSWKEWCMKNETDSSKIKLWGWWKLLLS